MNKCKDFLDVEMFTDYSKFAMGSHMKKPEVIEILRIQAIKYSDLQDFKKALGYLERADNLTMKILGHREHYRVLELKLCKIETILKQQRVCSEEEYVQAINEAEQAVALSNRLYGEISMQSSQALYLYAMTLSKIKSREAECEE